MTISASLAALWGLAIKRRIQLAAAAMLVITAAGHWPFGVYEFVRLAACTASAVLEWHSYQRNRPVWTLVLIGLALLFNPLIPIHFHRQQWVWLDTISAVIFLAAPDFSKSQSRPAQDISLVRPATRPREVASGNSIRQSPWRMMIEPWVKKGPFNGRAARAQFWWVVLFVWLCSIIGAVAVSMITLGGSPEMAKGAEAAIYFPLYIGLLEVSVRRLHDANRSGWWLWAPFAPLVPLAPLASDGLALGLTQTATILLSLLSGAIEFVILCWICGRGTAGPNRFGPDPIVSVARVTPTTSSV